jgi:hypothetical protein
VGQDDCHQAPTEKGGRGAEQHEQRHAGGGEHSRWASSDRQRERVRAEEQQLHREQQQEETFVTLGEVTLSDRACDCEYIFILGKRVPFWTPNWNLRTEP